MAIVEHAKAQAILSLAAPPIRPWWATTGLDAGAARFANLAAGLQNATAFASLLGNPERGRWRRRGLDRRQRRHDPDEQGVTLRQAVQRPGTISASSATSR